MDESSILIEMGKQVAEAAWEITRLFLVERRDGLGLTNYQLAKDADMPEATVHRIMAGQRVPSVINYFQLLAGLKINPRLVPKEKDRIKYPKIEKPGKN
jgi:predicted transcriptional regulator